MVALTKLISESIDNSINDDLDYKDLVLWYLESEKETIASLYDALENKDYNRINYLADMVYGHGGSFGFMMISYLGRAIGFAVKNKDDVEIATLISKLGDYVELLSVQQ